MRTLSILVCAILGNMALGLASEPETVQINLEPKTNVFSVDGLTTGQLESAKLKIFVADAMEDSLAVFGRQSVEDNRLLFRPRFPLDPGVTYRAVLIRGDLVPVRENFKITPTKPPQTPELTHVYPSGDTLPENLLKFYLHFSTPMRQGDSYRVIHLINDKHQEVELPFLEIDQEMWSPDGTRLTLLLDPGRIKRGLKPREDSGPALEAGRHYTLVVDAAWKNLDGKPMKETFRKSFRVSQADAEQPQIADWELNTPRRDSKTPLTVRFDEPLDHALASRVLEVISPNGRPIAGRIQVLNGETEWRLTPDTAWMAGEYQLRVETILEDRAGNSLGRPFEVDISQKSKRQPILAVVQRTFTIGE